MKDENAPPEPPEKPQSPAVVKSAVNTKAKTKPKAAPVVAEAPKPPAVNIHHVENNRVEKAAVEIPVETPKDFVDDAFSVFGWD